MKFFLPYLILLAALAPSASAQNGAISAIMTWGALSYVPPTYEGKVLPTAGTPVVAALELLDGGRIVNLSSVPISWLLDGKLIDSGVGKKTVSFKAAGGKIGGTHNVRAVFQYKNTKVEKSVIIPVAKPEVIIMSPYPKNIIKTGKSMFGVLPYYWNIASPSELQLEWSANGERQQTLGDAGEVELNVPDAGSGTGLMLNLKANNITNQLEFASATLNLQISQ